MNTPIEQTAKDRKLKVREKVAKTAKKVLQADMYTALDMEASHPLYDWQDSSSEDETARRYGKNGLKIETYSYRMSEVLGVRIFEKEILSSSL